MSGRLARLGALAFVALVASAGAAFATGALSGVVAADGSIQGCYQKNNGQLRVVRAASQCRPSEVPLRWSETGPQGDQGPRGATGPQGPTGEEGPQGEQGIQGEQGEGLTATAFGAGGARCDGRAGLLVSTESGEELGVVCDGADGAEGADGVDGQDGAPGAGLVGSACSRPNGDAGTIQMTVGSTGAISLTCQTSGGSGEACPSTLPSYPNAITGCAGGVVFITCSPGYFNPNGDIADGCEVNATGTAEVCDGLDNDGDGEHDEGTGGQPVAGGNGILVCVNGTLVAQCNPGFEGENCQINLMTDVNNCGAVGNGPPTNPMLHVAAWQCVAGSHRAAVCVTGWADTNGSPLDGCETALDLDPSGNTQGTAALLGSFDCFDSTRGFGGTLSGPGDHDWYRINANGGTFCLNDFEVLSFSCGAGCVYDVITNQESRFNLSGSSPTLGYNNGTVIYVHVHGISGGPGAPVTYSTQYHL